MSEWILIGSIALFLGIRAASFIRFWRTPFYFGADKFFGLPVAPDVSMPLLRRYRSRLMLVYLPDALCALAAYLWGGLIGLALEQIFGAIVTRLCQTLVAIHTIRQTKLLAAEGSWKPVASVALSLKTRRLRDYLDLRFELALPLLTVASLAIVASYFRHGSARSGPAGLVRALAIAALTIYVQLGGLLAKHAACALAHVAARRASRDLPAWREAVLNYFLWACDYLRATLTVAIVSFVLFANLRAAGARGDTAACSGGCREHHRKRRRWARHAEAPLEEALERASALGRLLLPTTEDRFPRVLPGRLVLLQCRQSSTLRTRPARLCHQRRK